MYCRALLPKFSRSSNYLGISLNPYSDTQGSEFLTSFHVRLDLPGHGPQFEKQGPTEKTESASGLWGNLWEGGQGASLDPLPPFSPDQQSNSGFP